MFGAVKNYSTPRYVGGSKLVDEGGQGSSNESYGNVVPVPFEPELPSNSVPYGVAHGNATPLVRGFNIVGTVVGAALLLSGWKRAGSWVLGLTAADVVVRQLSPNYDSAVSSFPFNAGVV